MIPDAFRRHPRHLPAPLTPKQRADLQTAVEVFEKLSAGLDVSGSDPKNIALRAGRTLARSARSFLEGA